MVEDLITMDAIAVIIGIIVVCLIPVAMTAVIVSDTRAGHKLELIEVGELFGIIVFYGVVAWGVLTAVSSLIYALLTHH